MGDRHVAVETSADILDFFELDDFAEEAAYTPVGGSLSTVLGIFDNPQANRNATDMMDITIPAPQFVCRTADVPDAADGDSIVIRTISYYAVSYTHLTLPTICSV